MRTVFTDEAPTAAFKGEMAYLTFPGEDHPTVSTPVDVLQFFCEKTLLGIAEHRRRPSNVARFKHKAARDRESGGH